MAKDYFTSQAIACLFLGSRCGLYPLHPTRPPPPEVLPRDAGPSASRLIPPAVELLVLSGSTSPSSGDAEGA